MALDRAAKRVEPGLALAPGQEPEPPAVPMVPYPPGKWDRTARLPVRLVLTAQPGLTGQ